MVDPSSARDLIKRLGTLLADLTMDRPAPRIHAEILQRLLDTTDTPDPQLSGIYFEEKDFSSVWTAIRNGASLPVSSWDTVVLPVVAFYSKPEALKANLGTAIHLWRNARNSLSNVLEPPQGPQIVPLYELMREETSDTLTLPPAPPMPREHVPVQRPRRSGRILAAATAGSLAITLAAVAFVVFDRRSNPTTLPPADSTPTQVVSPTGEASPSEMPPPVPTPAPGESGMLAPSAPRSAAVSAKTQTTVTLTWQSPINFGAGGVTYRIYRGMVGVGTASGQTHTVTGLTANTGYAFTIVAVDSAGTPSPPSNTVSVTTAPIPPGLKFSTTPKSPFPIGTSFSIDGSSWPCSGPARIEIYLYGRLIAAPQSDGAGNFKASFTFLTDGPHMKLEDISTGEWFVVDRGANSFVVVLPRQAQCTPLDPQTYSVTFS